MLQIVLFAPLAILFISIIEGTESTINASYSSVATSVAAFLGIPLGAAIVTRFSIRNLVSPQWYEKVFLK